MKWIFATLAVIAFSGCAGFDVAQSTIAKEGAAIADEARETSEFMLCRGITVGAWVRAYGGDPAKAQAWRTLCAKNVVETPAKR